ncbi:Putative Zn-dependent protease, contains TPR repeats [Raoultella planticola]|uniref:Zn-dependent protease, contains TPR repeats n=1 Tax=Raoultella planticola TaxID=575 RepID=A0A485BXY8_RAOPL|nr:Putative Zn-dependent protease, contains TPR repeats [Raoultella planticola]
MTATAGILLAQAEASLGHRDQELAARAEGMALVGQLDQAITLLSSASSQVKLGSLQQGALRCAVSTSCASCRNDSAPIKKCKETTCLTR